MFAHRSVTVDSFQRGEKVWAVDEERVVAGSINGSTHEILRVNCDGVRFWVSPTVVFKRPTEYHLLHAAVSDLIDDLRRALGNLLVEESVS